MAVYIIEAAGPDAVKIGYTNSNNIKTRLSQLQTGMPYPLLILKWFPDAPVEFERLLHSRFKHLHIRREWFIKDPEILDYIEAADWKSDLKAAKRKLRTERPKIGNKRHQNNMDDAFIRSCGYRIANEEDVNVVADFISSANSFNAPDSRALLQLENACIQVLSGLYRRPESEITCQLTLS